MIIKIIKWKATFFLIGKLHVHLIGLEPETSPSTMLLQGEVPFKLDLIGLNDKEK